jgi:hypothetical protein
MNAAVMPIMLPEFIQLPVQRIKDDLFAMVDRLTMKHRTPFPFDRTALKLAKPQREPNVELARSVLFLDVGYHRPNPLSHLPDVVCFGGQR